MLTIAHLTDHHFGGDPSAVERTTRVLNYLATLGDQVDVVVVTGDIADHGADHEYEQARRLLVEEFPLSCPVLMCPGNHDRREGFTQTLLGRRSTTQPVNTAQRIGDTWFLLCDTLVPAPPGERIDHGLLGAETLRWLDTMLGSRGPDERAFIGLHHPPMNLHVALMDPIKLADSDDLAVVLGRHDRVSALLVGHAHTMAWSSFAGVPVLVGGAVASTVTLDQEPGGPLTHDLPASFAYHLVDGDRITTHFRAVPG